MLLIIFIVAAITVIPHNAYAYLDPGTGSYILQMVIAGLLGAAFAFKIFWIRIKGFFVRIFARNNDES